MTEPLDLNFPSSIGQIINPSKEVKEHGEKLLSISDLRKRLRYYNKHVCSLVYGNYDGLHCFGERDHYHGEGKMFFSKSNPDSNSGFKIYQQERQKEINRLKSLIAEQKEYSGKLKCFLEAKAGQIRLETFELKVENNAYEEFMVNGGGTIPKHLLGNSAEIDLRPSSSDERKSYNLYLYNYVQALIKEPQKFHWLVEVAYEGFLSAPAIQAFTQQLNRAFDDKEAIIKAELHRVETKFLYNRLSDYRELLYPYQIENLVSWQGALFNALVKGDEFDFSRKELSVHEIKAIVHVEQVFEYFKELHKLKEEAQELKKYEAEKQSRQIHPVQVKTKEDIYKEIADRGKLQDFLCVPDADKVFKDAFWHDEEDNPADVSSNVYHPKYGRYGFEANSPDVIVTSFANPTITKDYERGTWLYMQYDWIIVCTADGKTNITNKDGKKIRKVDYTQTHQKRLAENTTDFETILQREFQAKELSDNPIFRSELQTHVQELIELHKTKSSYAQGTRDISLLTLADEFLKFLKSTLPTTSTAHHREVMFAHHFKVETGEAIYKTASDWYKERKGRSKIEFGTTIKKKNSEKYRDPSEKELIKIVELLEGFKAQQIAIAKLNECKNSYM